MVLVAMCRLKRRLGESMRMERGGGVVGVCISA